MSTDLAIEIQNLTKIFTPPFPKLRQLLRRSNKGNILALNNVSLTIRRGEVFGLVGRNGQGKTTLIKSIAALIEPTSGSIRVFDFDTATKDREAKGMIGLVSADERSFYGRMTGLQNLLFFARLYGLGKAHALRRILELAEILNFTDMLNRKFQALSTGNKQRLAIIRALLTNPPLILLDEPTRSLDPMAAEDLRSLIRDRLHADQKKTILITTHNLAEVEDLCGRVGFLSRGEMKLCASMDTLRASYCSRELVLVEVSGRAESNGWRGLKERVPSLEFERISGSNYRIRFYRQHGDDTLNFVFGRLLGEGMEIKACQTTRDGLREIMASIENEKNE